MLLFTDEERGLSMIGIQICSSVKVSHFIIENREKKPFYQHLCLVGTAPLYAAVSLLNTNIDPSPSFPASLHWWRHQVYLYSLNQKPQPGGMDKNSPLWHTILTKLFFSCVKLQNLWRIKRFSLYLMAWG